MLIPSVQGAIASTEPVADFSIVDSPITSPSTEPIPSAYSPPPNGPNNREPEEYETVRHMLFGPLLVVRFTIRLLHQRGYAEPND